MYEFNSEVTFKSEQQKENYGFIANLNPVSMGFSPLSDEVWGIFGTSETKVAWNGYEFFNCGTGETVEFVRGWKEVFDAWVG